MPDRLNFKFECRRLDQGGFEELRSVCQARDVKLLIIDVLAAFRPPQGRGNYYEWDFRSLHELQQLATELGIAVVVVHHTRKASANDPLDRVSGTTGLTGAADTVMTLCRQRASDYVLEGRGRDIEAFEWTMKFEDGKWRVGDEVDKLTPDQQRVVEVLRQTEGPMSPKDVATALGQNEPRVRQTLRRLAGRDVIDNPSYGLYTCHSVTPGTINH